MYLVCSVCELDVEEREMGRICRFMTKKSCAGSLIFFSVLMVEDWH